jgi:hypothetical protein
MFARQGFSEPLALYRAFAGARLNYLTARDVVFLIAYGTLFSNSAIAASMLSHNGADLKPKLKQTLGDYIRTGGSFCVFPYELDATFLPAMENNCSFVWRLVATAHR